MFLGQPLKRLVGEFNGFSEVSLAALDPCPQGQYFAHPAGDRLLISQVTRLQAQFGVLQHRFNGIRTLV
jgi:hypothetical protein